MTAVLIAVLVIGICGPVIRGQMAGCGAIEQTEGKKLVLSQIAHESFSGQNLLPPEQISRLFLFAVGGKLRGVTFGEGSDGPSPVLCPHRSPSIDGSDFTTALVKEMNRNDVLIEVWGSVTEPDATEGATADAWLAIVMIPVQVSESASRKPGFQRLRYKINAGEGPGDVLDKFSGVEFEVFTQVAYGVKALRNLDYDMAQKALCAAHLRLEDAAGRQEVAMGAVDADGLARYIQEKIKQTIEAARSDSNYRGALTTMSEILNDDTLCPLD